jgi:ribonuclease H2 subunit A
VTEVWDEDTSLKHSYSTLLSQQIYVDTVGKEKPYQDKLKEIFPGIEITVASKADSKYPIVSAASIFAKVIRDWVIKRWIFPERGLNNAMSTVFGSGYPSGKFSRKFC